MATSVRIGEVIIDPVRLAEFERSPLGPVLRDLIRRGTNVQLAAIAQVGKRTRRLERSITKRPGVDARGPFVVIVADTSYALWHHEGTPPHIIRPRFKKALRFPGPGKGGVVFARVVHHPGTKPNRFLTDSLRAARR